MNYFRVDKPVNQSVRTITFFLLFVSFLISLPAYSQETDVSHDTTIINISQESVLNKLAPDAFENKAVHDTSVIEAVRDTFSLATAYDSLGINEAPDTPLVKSVQAATNVTQDTSLVKSAPDTSIPEVALILSKYISYPSVSGTEKPAGEYLMGQCRKKGLYIRVFSDKIDSYNFSASLYPLELNKPNIIFLSHIDVVPAGEEELWSHNPFSGEIFLDTLWGRGTLDMKDAAVMELLAVSSFTDLADTVDLPFNVSLLCVSGEETFGFNGSRVISRDHLPELNPFLIIGEGGAGVTGIVSKTPGKPVFLISVNDKRAVWLSLNLHHETSGHGAVPPDQYANMLMINALNNIVSIRPPVKFNDETKEMLRALGKLEGGMKRCIMGSPGLFKPIIAASLRKDPLMLSAVTNTVTVTRVINPETEINQIPQDISALLDCRLLPETGTEDFLDHLRRKMGNNNIDIEIVEETSNAPTTERGEYYRMLADAIISTYEGAAVVPILFPATTDNNFFRAQGIPVLGTIPVCLTQDLLETIHNYNERIPVEALVKGTETYRRFIEKLLLPQE